LLADPFNANEIPLELKVNGLLPSIKEKLREAQRKRSQLEVPVKKL
jgi:hypothetical protein